PAKHVPTRATQATRLGLSRIGPRNVREDRRGTGGGGGGGGRRGLAVPSRPSALEEAGHSLRTLRLPGGFALRN
ncbi:hypothetical protein P7K49_011694, partial [Saguinus oedipus]